MTSSSFTIAFPDRSRAIVNAFFTSTDVTDKTWSSVRLLADADDLTLWTVVANHPRIGSVLTNLVTAVDVAHSSSSAAQRKAVKKEDERALCTVIIRIATMSGYCTGEKEVDPRDFARRLDVVLPLAALFPTAAMLFRRSGATASIVLTSLFLLNPAYLCRLPLHLLGWFDHVNRLATRCQAELLRGRYQRLSGDVLPLFEQTYRTTKHLWAMFQSVPFVADYIPVMRTLRALRVIVDVLSPILQHFLMTCEGLNTRRDILSKANAMIVNTAVNAAATLVVFHTFSRPGGQRAWVVEGPPKTVYDSLNAFLLQYSSGTPEALLSSLPPGRTLHTLMHQLSPPLDDAEDNQIGKVILSLLSPISDSKDFADLLLAARERFGEVVLLELVQQGLAIDALLARRFVTSDEAKKLGASEDVIARNMAGLPAEDTLNVPDVARPASAVQATENSVGTAATHPETGKDPLVDMVAEVFPNFHRHGIRAALNYYNNDPEQFILDASMANIPPHLQAQLEASSAEEAVAVAQVPAQAAANAAIADAVEVSSGAKSENKHQHLTASDFVDDAEMADLQLYLGSDLYELVTGSDRDDDSAYGADAGGYQDFSSYRKDDGSELYDSGGGFGGVGVDDEMREKIRMLTEAMYDDELDDGQLDEVHVANAGTDTDDEAEADGGEYAGRGGTASPSAAQDGPGAADAQGRGGGDGGPRPPPRSDYDRKQFRARIARERSKNIKEKNAESAEGVAPSYAKKQKTSRQKKGGAGGKDALTRAFKKGAL